MLEGEQPTKEGIGQGMHQTHAHHASTLTLLSRSQLSLDMYREQ